MRKMRFVVRMVRVAVAALSVACGSSSGDKQSATSAGTGGSAAGAGGSAAGGVAGSSGHASGGSETASGGSSQEGGAAGAASNLYIDGLRTNNPDACLPLELPFGATGGPDEGRVACTIAELHFDACDCAQPGHAALSAELLTAFKNKAEQWQFCGEAPGPDCNAACGCELVQLPGTAADTSSQLYACQNDVTPPEALAGFCVIDQERMDAGGPAPIGNPEIVANCPTNSHRRIRFVGQDLLSSEALAFIACTTTKGP